MNFLFNEHAKFVKRNVNYAHNQIDEMYQVMNYNSAYWLFHILISKCKYSLKFLVIFFLMNNRDI